MWLRRNWGWQLPSCCGFFLLLCSMIWGRWPGLGTWVIVCSILRWGLSWNIRLVCLWRVLLWHLWRRIRACIRLILAILFLLSWVFVSGVLGFSHGLAQVRTLWGRHFLAQFTVIGPSLTPHPQTIHCYLNRMRVSALTLTHFYRENIAWLRPLWNL